MKKSSTEEFIKEAEKVWGNKYDYSLVEYVSARNKVKIIYKDWIFEQSPDNHLRGKECEKRWNTDRFIFESKKIHGDKYDYSLVDFINMNTPIKLILDEIVYNQTPYKNLMGREIEKGIRLKTTEEFIKDAKKVWGNKYDYSLVEYKGTFSPIKIIYNGITYKQKPCTHLIGMKCERDTIKCHDDFIRKAIEKHGNKYDYSLTEYKGIEKKIKIIFNGDIYEQKAGAHLYAGLIERRRNRKTNEIFIGEANQIHDFKYDYSKVSYINNKTKVIIICPIHGEFNQLPGSHLQGHGCTYCMESNGEKEVAKFLKKYKINYSREHKFKDCIGKRYKLPFDFYIPSMRTCIEFDGKQHYFPMPFFGGQEALNMVQATDKVKSNYCEDHYINLIRIRYDQIDNIHKILWENLKNQIRR